MNCHCCTKMCMFEQRIIINTAMLSCSGRAAISQLWWLNTGGKGSSERRLQQYFTHLDLLNATAHAPSESVRQHHFPKNSCYLSDFLIRVDSWLHCTGFGRGTAALTVGMAAGTWSPWCYWMSERVTRLCSLFLSDFQPSVTMMLNNICICFDTWRKHLSARCLLFFKCM